MVFIKGYELTPALMFSGSTSLTPVMVAGSCPLTEKRTLLMALFLKGKSVSDLNILDLNQPPVPEPEIRGHKIVLVLYVRKTRIVTSNVVPDERRVVSVTCSIPEPVICHGGLEEGAACADHAQLQILPCESQIHLIVKTRVELTNDLSLIIGVYLAVIVHILVHQVTYRDIG